MSESLKRRIGLVLLTAYGVGVMVGAGIYVLVGAVAAQAGSLAWVAFLIAGLVAAPTALSFAELSARIPEAGGAAAYLRHAFQSRRLSVLAGLAIVVAGTVSAAAVLQGGVGYLSVILPLPGPWAIIAIGAVLTFIALWGVAESLSVAAILTGIEVAGLALIVVSGFTAEPVSPPLAEAARAVPLTSLLAAAGLAFFAFIGFEDMVNLAEETRNPTRTMPFAIVVSLALVSLIYAAVAYAATRAVAPEVLAASDQPLALVWQAGFGKGVAILSGIAVAAALNGVLAQIVMASRVLFGLGRSGQGFEAFTRTHPRFGTPVWGTALVGFAVVLGALTLPVSALAEISASVLLAVFVLVNAGLIRLKRQSPDAPFRLPIFVPVLGLILSAAALALSLGVTA